MSAKLLKQAIKVAGSEAKLAAAIGYSQPAINKAKHRGVVAAEMALAIHQATKGEVSASALRPDLWPTERHLPFGAGKAA